MSPHPENLWIADCAQRLQQHWRMVDLIELKEVASSLWRDARWRAMPPAEAASDWLKPIEQH